MQLDTKERHKRKHFIFQINIQYLSGVHRKQSNIVQPMLTPAYLVSFSFPSLHPPLRLLRLPSSGLTNLWYYIRRDCKLCTGTINNVVSQATLTTYNSFY